MALQPPPGFQAAGQGQQQPPAGFQMAQPLNPLQQAMAQQEEEPQAPRPGALPGPEQIAQARAQRQQQMQQMQQMQMRSPHQEQQAPPQSQTANRGPNIPINEHGVPYGFRPFNATEDKPEMLWSDVLMEAVQNAPKSAGRYVGDTVTGIYQAVRHPVETAEAVGSLITGVVARAMGDKRMSHLADPVFDYVQDRYGDIEAFKKAVAEDPVGVVAEVGSVLIPVTGAATKGVSLSKMTSKMAKSQSKAMQHTGHALAQLEDAGKRFLRKSSSGELVWSIPKGVVDLGNVIPRTGASRWLMSKSLKAPKDIAQTALDKDIYMNIKGAEAIRTKINDLGNKIDAAIDNLDANGIEIPVGHLMKDFRVLLKEARLESGEAYRGVVQEMRDLQKLSKEHKGTLKPSEVQIKKRKTYERLKGVYEGWEKKTPRKEAKMNVANAAMEILEKHGPELIGLNKEMGELLELDKVVQRYVNSMPNSSFLDMVAPAYAMGRVAGPKGQAMMVGIKAINSPWFRSRVAHTMDRVRKQGVHMNESKLQRFVELGANMRMGLTMAERMDRESQGGVYPRNQ